MARQILVAFVAAAIVAVAFALPTPDTIVPEAAPSADAVVPEMQLVTEGGVTIPRLHKLETAVNEAIKEVKEHDSDTNCESCKKDGAGSAAEPGAGIPEGSDEDPCASKCPVQCHSCEAPCSPDSGGSPLSHECTKCAHDAGCTDCLECHIGAMATSGQLGGHMAMGSGSADRPPFVPPPAQIHACELDCERLFPSASEAQTADCKAGCGGHSVDPCSSACPAKCDACAFPCNGTPFADECSSCVAENECQNCYNCHMTHSGPGAGDGDDYSLGEASCEAHCQQHFPGASGPEMEACKSTCLGQGAAQGSGSTDPCSDMCPAKCHECGEPCAESPFADACKSCVDAKGCQMCYDCHMGVMGAHGWNTA